MNFAFLSLLLVHISSTNSVLEGGSFVLRILNGKMAIPRTVLENISIYGQQKTKSSTENDKVLPSPTPQIRTTNTPAPKQRKNRPGKKERERKRKMSSKIATMESNDQITTIEFDVEKVNPVYDESGEIESFETIWAATNEPPFSFYNNPRTLIEKCDAFKDFNEDQVKAKLREIASKADGVTYIDDD